MSTLSFSIHKLPQVTGHLNSSVDEDSQQGFKTGYNSIFDSLPEAPIAPSEIDSSVIEVFHCKLVDYDVTFFMHGFNSCILLLLQTKMFYSAF